MITAVRKMRAVNELTTDLVSEHPGHFGFFAEPMVPDVDGALAEAAYPFDTLKAVGVILLSDIRGTYAGNPYWDPLMEQ